MHLKDDDTIHGNSLPELQACRSVRASILRQLLRDRNTVDSKLATLACPQPARKALAEWFDDVVGELPNPGRLAQSLLESSESPAVFEMTWETLESTHGVLGRMPRPASDYLHAVAPQDNAETLELFYWSHLHHPLRDQLDLMRQAVTDLVLSDPLTRRVQAALRQHDAGAPSGSAQPDPAGAAIPKGLDWAADAEKDAVARLTRTADPIARLLSDVEIQPIDLSQSGGLLAHRRVEARRQATRRYAMYYVQERLRLPAGRHVIAQGGQPGDDFWVDFGDGQDQTVPSDRSRTRS